MSSRIYCLMGKFASGKTTVAKLLEERYGVNRVVTCTTRAKRENERDGIDYFFLSDDEFETKFKNGELAAVNRIEKVDTNDDVVFPFRKMLTLFKKRYVKKYGVPIDKIGAEEGIDLIVIEPYGYFDLLKKLGPDKVRGIFLKLEDKERLFRALHREQNPNCEDICLKFMEELEYYNGVEDSCHMIIENVYTSDKAAEEVYNFIIGEESKDKKEDVV